MRLGGSVAWYSKNRTGKEGMQVSPVSLAGKNRGKRGEGVPHLCQRTFNANVEGGDMKHSICDRVGASGRGAMAEGYRQEREFGEGASAGGVDSQEQASWLEG